MRITFILTFILTIIIEPINITFASYIMSNNQVFNKYSVVFDTATKTYGTETLPIFTIDPPLKRVRKVIIDKVVLPYSFYTFNTGNNDFDFNGPRTINAGIYTATELAAEVQRVLRLNYGYEALTCTFTSGVEFRRFTIACALPFTIDIDNNLSRIMGFASENLYVNATSVRSEFPIYETRFFIFADNRSFMIRQSSVTYTINIAEGTYTGAQIATELQNKLNDPLADFVVTYSPTTFKLTISNVTPFSILTTGTATNLLGFGGYTTEGAIGVVTAPNPVQLTRTYSILVKSYLLNKARNSIPKTNASQNDILYEFLINSSPGTVIYHEALTGNELNLTYRGGLNISSIDLRITDDFGRQISFTEFDRWKVHMTFETF